MSVNTAFTQTYLVLARKYRPSTFSGVIGQEHVVRTLVNSLQFARVHHAFLFTGARGVGKTTMARVLAAALNCTALTKEGDPCGQCVTCVEIAKCTNTDVLEIDGASHTGVDDIRELREQVGYLPSHSRYKVYIIDEVHMLSSAAFNALLKTLEEPPAHVKFIFATTEPQKIPITILSRCQRFDFRKVSLRVLLAHLQHLVALEGVALSEAILLTIAKEAAGSVRDALSLLDQVVSYVLGAASVTEGQARPPSDQEILAMLGIIDRQLIFALGKAILRKDATRLLELIAEFDNRGQDLMQVAELLLTYFRDLTVVKATYPKVPAELLESLVGEIASLQEVAAALRVDDLDRLFMALVKVTEDLKRSEYARLSLEMGLLSLLALEPVQQIQELLGSLEELWQATTGGKASLTGSSVPGSLARRANSGPASSNGEVKREVAAEAGTVVATIPAAKAEIKPSTSARVEVNTQAPGEPSRSQWGSPQRQADFPEFLSLVHKARPVLAAMLQHGEVQQFSSAGLKMRFLQHSIYADTVCSKEHKVLLEGLLERYFGCKVNFNWELVKEELWKTAGGGALSANAQEVRGGGEPPGCEAGAVMLSAGQREPQAVSSASAGLEDSKLKTEGEFNSAGLLQSALADPAVNSVLQVLGGEIAVVRPLT